MKLYFAPLEGITSYIFRNTHHKCFDGCDAYYAPFITPAETEKNSPKNLKGILPENNNPELSLKVQALTNNAEAFLKFSEVVKDLGYDEINMNLGCPSQTVVKKGKGAGLLRDTDKLEEFLDKITTSDMKISIKTRTGISNPCEMDDLMNIYNKYSLSLLIIHPRLREDFYKGVPDMEVFKKAYNISKNKVCYNGNILTVQDFQKIVSEYKELDSVMIGRGAITNPAIFREIKGGKKLETKELLNFSEELLNAYYETLKSEKFTLQKMKEVWALFMENYPEEKKILKAIKKANHLSDLKDATKNLPEIQ